MKLYVRCIVLIVLVLSFTGCSTKDNEGVSEFTIESETSNSEVKTDNVEEMSIDEYFKVNSFPVTVDDEYTTEGLEILEDDLNNLDIFFTGEFHGTQANYQLKTTFIKFFKEKTNFKYLLCELPYSSTYYLNKYLKTGDEGILDQVSALGKHSLFSSEEDYSQWKEFYEFNESLKENERIIAIGVDLEHDQHIALSCLDNLLSEKEVPIEIQDSILLVDKSIELINKSFQNQFKVIENCEIILNDIQFNREIYENCLQDDLIYFELVIKNLVNYKEASKLKNNYVEFHNTRDKMIYENFVALDNFLSKGKYFGQWGAGHVLQEKNNDITCFASHLNSKNSKYEDKILSIVFNYIDCEVMASTYTGASDLEVAFHIIEERQDIYDEKFIIYKLYDDIKRPEITMLVSDAHEQLESDISNYFQYVLLIKDSKATVPLM